MIKFLKYQGASEPITVSLLPPKEIVVAPIKVYSMLPESAYYNEIKGNVYCACCYKKIVYAQIFVYYENLCERYETDKEGNFHFAIYTRERIRKIKICHHDYQEKEIRRLCVDMDRISIGLLPRSFN